MSTTIVDLSLQADSTSLDKAQKALKDAGQAAKASAVDFKAMEDQMKGLAKQIDSVTGVLSPLKAGLSALGGALFVDKLVGFFKAAVDGAASLNNLSMKTGMAVEQLSIMKSVASQSGTSIDTVADAMIKFQKGLAAAGRDTSIQAKAFAELGISTKDTTRTTEEYLDLVTKKLAGLHDGWEKNNIVMALFGKTGTELNEFLADYAGRGEQVAKVLAEQAAQAEEYERSIKRLGAMGTQLQQVFGLGLMPVVKGLADEFLGMATKTGKLDAETRKLLMNDVEEWGWKAAKSVAAVVDVFGALWGTLRFVGEMIGITAGRWVGYAEVVVKALSGDVKGAIATARANELTYVNSVNEAVTKLTGSYNLNAMAAVDAAKAKRDATKNDKLPEDTRPRAKNIGEEGTKGAADPIPAESGFTAAMKKEEDGLLNLNKQYRALFGIHENIHQQELQASIDAGEFAEKRDKQGRLIKMAATEEQLAALKVVAAGRDRLEVQIREEQAQKALWAAVQKTSDAEQAKLSAMRQSIAEENIAREVLKVHGATQNDVTIAVNNYNIAQAQAALTIAQLTGASEQEVETLKIKLETLKEMGVLQLDKKQADDAEIAHQKTFSYGWEQAFTKYKDDATNAATHAQTIFSVTTRGMEDMFINFAKTGKLSFDDMTQAILADLIKIAAHKAAAGMLNLALTALAFSKDGNVFGNTGILKSANGNVFDSPTLHSYSGGVGMLGEAGPESVMPLKRNAQGQLGVIAQGSGSTNQNISIAVNVQGGNTNAETASAVANKVAEQFTRGIVRQELLAAKRTGGILNPV